MRSKRLLTILLVLCMLISTLSPAVYAAQPAAGSENKYVTTEKATNGGSGLIASPNASANVPTLKNDALVSSKVETPETTEATGQWDITEIEDLGANLFHAETPECLNELKEAAEQFAADEKVLAFVVMEEKPLAEIYSSIFDVSSTVEKKLLTEQDAVLNAIEKKVIDKDEELNVRYQFTYLTNAISIETEFSNLAEIALLDNVKSVFVMPYYKAIATDATSTNKPMTASSAEMTGVGNVWQELGYTGAGMKIAVIDTGLDLDHPSFAADPASGAASMTVEDIESVLTELNAYKRYRGLTAGDLYRSAKVPYAFNYSDTNLTADHSRDNQGDHGTHVSGIAAANALDSTKVVGMAPDAQIIVMKVFGQNPQGASADNIVAALEDAMTLGCDVVNASLGSAAGFASSDTEIDLIYERLASCDIVATYSAGNEGVSSANNLWGNDLNPTTHPDNATVGSPSTYVNTLSIASAENAKVMTSYFSLADGTKVFYMDSIEYLYSETEACMAALAGSEYEYVIVPGLGTAEDFAQVDVTGKIAVVKRGELSFSDKAFNAEWAGAVGCIIWNNNDEDDIFSFGMTTASTDGMIPSIPVSLITLSDGTKMEEAETKTMTPTADMAEREANGGQMSSFSSWGVSPDLQLVPDITGIGGNVYSCYDEGKYGLMSGTSMSAPQVAGVSALVMQYLHELYPNVPDGSLRKMAEALLMSTADPIISTDSGVEVSPRQQGAGLVDAFEATTTTSYLTVGGNRPKAELGDNASGVYAFSFEIHNFGDEAKTYTLSSSLLTEECIDYGIGEYFMAGFDVALTGSVKFEKDTVTVPAGGKANVKAAVVLSDEDKAMFAKYWKNGGYVEGFVYLTNEEGEQELNLPFLGFYGDWTDAPVFDSAFWYDNTFFGINPANGLPEGNEYYNVMWTSLAGTDWVLGMNPYTGAVVGADGKVIYDPAHNSVSPNGDGVIDGLVDVYLSLMRNAKQMTFTYTVDGEVMHVENYRNCAKTMYNSNYGQIIPWLYDWYGTGLYDFTDADGNVLPNGTEVLLTIEARVDYNNAPMDSIVIPITVDTEGGELISVAEDVIDETAAMGIEVNDNVGVAAVFVMNSTGTQVYGSASDVEMTKNENGNLTAVFDVTDLGTELVVCVADYAGNERYYNVTYTAAGDNLPEMNMDALYAYRVYDDHIMSDHMYGWIELSKPASADENANISVWTDDYMEYAAINAAEYAGGKIFAVDAVYNLFVMTPGLFNRQLVTNLGVNVIDMTFDDSTDTMYVLSKQDSNAYLYSMDLMTGELTQLKSYGYYYNAPWAIADDDNGSLYAIRINKSGIYSIDVAGGTYAATEVTDAEGNPIVITDSYGDPVVPSANSQSITYLDGNLYWAYYKFSYYGGSAELITINTADWTSFASPYAAQAYDYENNLVEYYPMTELVGLMSLTDTDYQIPASNEAVSVSLDAEEIILTIGTSSQLSASWLPWNYDLDETQLVWTSSNESVATVTDGFVYAVGEGTATVTVSYKGLSASCNVIVVDVQGNFEAYNYYSGDGYYGTMIDVDMATMDYSLVTGTSPVDFMAGDYNGHDGYFYGYDQGGQLYRYDYETNEATELGTSIGTYPVDMAYDYSTGMMYALTLDYNTYQNTLYAVNMNNGTVMNAGMGQGLMTLAIDTEGTMYSVDAYGTLCRIHIQDNSDYGMGIILAAEPLMEETFGELYLLQSMCWDHNNDVLLWNWCEGATIMWIDLNNGDPFVVDLGDPSESGVIELTGMHVVPDEIPELPEVAVKSVTAEDMMIFTGYEKVPAVTVAPFNATCQDMTLVSADPAVVEVTASGNLKAIAAGETTVTASLTDDISGESYEVTFTVTVMDGADNLYAHMLTDVATMNAQLWVELDVGNPGTYEIITDFYYTIFTQEYVDGKIYTYGYDAADWEANWQFFVLNAETYEIEKQIDMGEAFPYVYDMTYDHVTSTMYLLAGASEDNTDLYVANMETGEITLLMETDPLLMAIAATPDGLMAIENSTMESEDWDPWAQPVLGEAKLHVIDPLTGTLELVGSTGLKSNMISSMTYDYDTDALYWAAFAQEGAGYVSHLAILDTETGLATSLGTIGSAGAQVGGLYVVCDEFPAADNSTLHNLVMATKKLTLTVGQTDGLSLIMMPGGIDADIVWTSSDESIATVDENGNVTGVAKGSVTITATATYNGVTKSATSKVAVLEPDAAFLTYSTTNGGWAAIYRNDFTKVNTITAGEEVDVAAIANVNGDVYGYDVDGQLFKLDTETFERISIGDGLGLEVDDDMKLFIRDMGYDAAGDRVLVLGDLMVWSEYDGDYAEIYGGCGLFVADLTTGELTQIYAFQDDTFVYAMDIDSNGNVYYYNTFNDNVQKLSLNSGVITSVVTLQTQSLYGDAKYDYSLYYDELTDTLYMLFTSNGNFYKMVTIDATLGTLIDHGYVGEVVRDGWYYIGNYVRGLTYVDMHYHVIDSAPTFTWADDHSACTVTYVCAECGETVTVNAAVTTENTATCTEDGEITYTASFNGYTDSYTEASTATGHDLSEYYFAWGEDYSECAIIFTCSNCFETFAYDCEVTSDVTEATCETDGLAIYTAVYGDYYADIEIVLPATGHDGAVCGNCGYIQVPEQPYKIVNVVNGVHVYWNAIEGVAKYGVWRSETGEDGSYKWLANPTVNHFTDTTAESGKTYFYKISSMDVTTGKHSDKSEALGTTFVGTPDITSRANATDGIVLKWNKIEGAAGYAIYRKSYSGSDEWVRVTTIAGNDTFTWTDTSVKTQNGVVYKYTIRALSGTDMEILSGCRNAGRTMTRLTTMVLTGAEKTAATSVKCKWSTSSKVDGYQIRFCVDGEVYKTFTVNNYKTGVKTFIGLEPDQTYTVEVRTYKTVEGIGTFYSDWSLARNVAM